MAVGGEGSYVPGMGEVGIVVVVVGMMLVAMGLGALVVGRGFVRVGASEALVVHGARPEPKVSFTGMLVLPFQSHERVDLSVKELVIERRGRDSLRCRDQLRADVVVAVSVAVSPTTDDVLRAARSLGAARTADDGAVRGYFESRLVTALAEVVRAVDYDALIDRRGEVADRFVEVVGKELDGYEVREAHFRLVEQTPLDVLDPNDILDAVAIRTITERAGPENARTREILLERRRAEADASLAAAEARATDSRGEGGYRSDVAATAARVDALEGELDEARRVLEALRGK